MPRSARSATPARLATFAAALIALSACTTPSDTTPSDSATADAPPPASTPASDGALQVGQQATLQGEVLSIDTDPWAYDGNAVVSVSTATAGTIGVQLPARWNLCKAQPHDVQALQPGDRVEVVGSVTAPGEVVVCEQPAHRLRKLD